MVDINDIYKSNSQYLKAEDIGTNMWTVTIASADVNEFENGDRKIVLAFQDMDKTMPLNVTNARSIADLYGHNSNDWIGRQIMLFTMPVQFQDRMVQAVRIRAPAGQQQPPQRTQQPQQSYSQASSGYDESNPPPASAEDYMRAG